MYQQRMQRYRRLACLRQLFDQSGRVEGAKIIAVLFVCPDALQELDSGGLSRVGISHIQAVVRVLWARGTRVLAVFPVIDASERNANASYALRSDNIVMRAIKAVKSACPQMGVMADIALDPFTNHCHDGLLGADGVIDNDKTVSVLVQMSLLYARAGCDIMGLSDMMDMRLRPMRDALEAEQLGHVMLFSYVKFHSAFYAPFRCVLGVDAQRAVSVDKSTYQVPVANKCEAIRQIINEAEQGADAIIIKPAMMYLDICVHAKQACSVPLIAYQTSGEYLSLKMCMGAKKIAESVIQESMSCIGRAGCVAAVSYFPLDLALSE